MDVFIDLLLRKVLFYISYDYCAVSATYGWRDMGLSHYIGGYYYRCAVVYYYRFSGVLSSRCRYIPSMVRFIFHLGYSLRIKIQYDRLLRQQIYRHYLYYPSARAAVILNTTANTAATAKKYFFITYSLNFYSYSSSISKSKS